MIREDTGHEDIIGYRKTFVHPYFNFPSIYNDISVIELGNQKKCVEKCSFFGG